MKREVAKKVVKKPAKKVQSKKSKDCKLILKNGDTAIVIRHAAKGEELSMEFHTSGCRTDSAPVGGLVLFALAELMGEEDSKLMALIRTKLARLSDGN